MSQVFDQCIKFKEGKGIDLKDPHFVHPGILNTNIINNLQLSIRLDIE